MKELIVKIETCADCPYAKRIPNMPYPGLWTWICSRLKITISCNRNPNKIYEGCDLYDIKHPTEGETE